MISWKLLTIVGIGGSLVWVGCKSSRAGYESAAYEAVDSAGAFEVREYPALPLATTSMGQQDRKSSNGGFQRLFRYISGSNQADQKIAMTTPVFMDQNNGDTTVSFVLPDDVAAAGAPSPTGEAVELSSFNAGRYGVLRFSGGQSRQNEKQALADLETILAERELTSIGEPIFAYYDPPWTPGPLRRNEVLLRLAD